MKLLYPWLSGALLLAVGAATGFLLGHEQHAVEGDEHAHESVPELLPQTLKNLGVTTGKVEAGSFQQFREVHGVMRDAPLNLLPVVSPVAGVVRSVAMMPGQSVGGGAVLAEIVRASLPRPELTLTGKMFEPVSEGLHASFSELRLALSRLQIVDRELQRIREINASSSESEVPVVARNRVIELENEHEQLHQQVENARRELEHHGLSEAEIAAVEKGGHAPRRRDSWKRALQVHGLWTSDVQALHALLPEPTRDLPWTIALLGELAAGGQVRAGLVAAAKESAAMREHFDVVATLLLRGETVVGVRRLADLGALEPVVRCRAPAGEGFDVVDVYTRPDERVEAGASIGKIHDPRVMWLRLTPVGDEVALVAKALRDGSPVEARALVEGSGPKLSDLRIERFATHAEGGGDAAIITCRNQRLDSGKTGARSWALRDGLRYVVRIPLAPIPDVFVLRKDAVADDGVDRVVFVPDGDSFKARPVHVVYEDTETVVVANDGAIFPGDTVVLSGAFALGVALQDGGTPHGHSH